MQQHEMVVETILTADELLANGHHGALLALTTRALLDGGEHARLRAYRARALMALHRIDEAEEDLAVAIRLDPAWALPHRLLCEISLRRGDLERAESYLERAALLDPAHPRTRDLARVTEAWRAGRAARAQPGAPRRAA